MSFCGGDSDMVLMEHHVNCFSSESERPESDEFNAALTPPDTTDTWNSELHMCTDPKHVPLPWKLLPVAAPAQSFGEQNQDVALLLSVLQSVSVLSDTDENVSPSGTLSEHEEQRVAKGGRWWTQSTGLQMCPLARFPIGMLPYPPFKFRKDPTRADPHRLVDGKYLALLLISSGDLEVCGRGFESTDVEALDAYVHRCRLGPFRLGRALSLDKEVAWSKTEHRRMEAAQELHKLRQFARSELGRLQKIQKKRLFQMQRTNRHARQDRVSGEPNLVSDAVMRNRVIDQYRESLPRDACLVEETGGVLPFFWM